MLQVSTLWSWNFFLDARICYLLEYKFLFYEHEVPKEIGMKTQGRLNQTFRSNDVDLIPNAKPLVTYTI